MANTGGQVPDRIESLSLRAKEAVEEGGGHSALGRALLELVRDMEGQLDVGVGRLEQDTANLPPGASGNPGFADLTTEAAYIAGQRKVLERVMETLLATGEVFHSPNDRNPE
jgi:hypothetical protein